MKHIYHGSAHARKHEALLRILKWTLLRIYAEFGGRYRVFLGVIYLQWSGETRKNSSAPSMSRTFCNPGDWVKKGVALGERVEVHVLRL